MSTPDHSSSEWQFARQALHELLIDAMRRWETIKLLRDAKVRGWDVVDALVADPALLARVRAEQDRALARLVPVGDAPPEWAEYYSPRDGSVLLTALAFVLGYAVLLWFAFRLMPLDLQVFCVAGLLAVIMRCVLAAVRHNGIFHFIAAIIRYTLSDDVDSLGGNAEHLISTLIVPAIRSYVGAQHTPLSGNALSVIPSPALYDEDDRGTILVQTGALRRMQRILERSKSGAVALAGGRGTGKSMVIQALLQGNLRGSGTDSLTVVASAPARYDARDFVLHLYAQLCRAVTHRINRPTRFGLDQFAKMRDARFRRIRTTRQITMFAGLALLYGIPLAYSLIFTGTTASISDLGWLLPLRLDSFAAAVQTISAVLLGIYLLAVVLRLLRRLLAAMSSGARYLLSADDELEVLRTLAHQQLERIRFLQTSTTGWSGKISLPLSNEVSRSRQIQQADQPFTHPEVVAEFRAFAERAVAVLQRAGVCDRFIIAIDELDKIGQQEKAHEFVNDIKGIFGISGCLFVVSVSDEAVVSFERRGIAVRDAFDSAFSEMLTLEPFALPETAQWIENRLPGSSREFVWLCQCLSGGLPRDVRRYAIEMLDLTTDVYQPDLGTVASRLINSDLKRKIIAFADVANTIDDPQVPAFLADLSALPGYLTPSELAAAAVGLQRSEPPELRRVTGQASAFIMLSSTMLTVFTESAVLSVENVERLALARRQLGIDWFVAWQQIQLLRESLGMASVT